MATRVYQVSPDKTIGFSRGGDVRGPDLMVVPTIRLRIKTPKQDVGLELTPSQFMAVVTLMLDTYRRTIVDRSL